MISSQPKVDSPLPTSRVIFASCPATSSPAIVGWGSAGKELSENKHLLQTWVCLPRRKAGARQPHLMRWDCFETSHLPEIDGGDGCRALLSALAWMERDMSVSPVPNPGVRKVRCLQDRSVRWDRWLIWEPALSMLNLLHQSLKYMMGRGKWPREPGSWLLARRRALEWIKYAYIIALASC